VATQNSNSTARKLNRAQNRQYPAKDTPDGDTTPPIVASQTRETQLSSTTRADLPLLRSHPRKTRRDSISSRRCAHVSLMTTGMIHKGERLRRLHAGGVGTVRPRRQIRTREGRRQPAEFPLHAEESARLSGAEIRAEGGREAARNLLRFRMWSSIWPWATI
jgi:hypothetical protein